jgi:site-specific DNA recombinase
MGNSTDHVIKVAIYSRVSTQEQADTNTSLNFQNEQLTNYCHLQGLEIFQNYVDPGYMGKDGNRPALKRMLDDAKLGLFNRVVVTKLDRLSRNLRLLLEIEETLKKSGVSVSSIKESIDTSVAIGKACFQVLGLVSEWDRSNIIERCKNGRIQRYKEGGCGPGNPPYGYKFNKTTKKLDISEQEARVVRIIFQEYASGKSMAQVANFLNSEKIPSRNSKGKGWRNTAIRDVLIDTVYKGSRIVNVYQKSKSLPELLPDTAITIAVPAIIDESTWNTAQDRRKNNKHLQPIRKEKYLLQGLINCAECGHTFQITLVHGRRTYSCRGRLKYTHLDDSPRCTVQNIDAVWLEEQVWQRIDAIINDPIKAGKIIDDTIVDLKNREAELSARIKPIEQRLAVIAEQKTRLAEEWFQLNLHPDKWKELKRNLEQEESRLKSIRNEIDPAQIEDLEQTKRDIQFWSDHRAYMVWNLKNEDGTDFRLVDWPHEAIFEAIESKDGDKAKHKYFPKNKREVLDLLQVRLMVYTDRIEIKAIFPIEPIIKQLSEPDCMSARCRQSR